LSSRHHDVIAVLLPSRCDKSGTSCYYLFTRFMTVTNLLQVVPTRLIQAVRNRLLRACCHQLVGNLFRADDFRLVGTIVASLMLQYDKLSSDLPTTGNKQCEHSLLNTACWQSVHCLRLYQNMCRYDYRYKFECWQSINNYLSRT
jgi:hypothetical protein